MNDNVIDVGIVPILIGVLEVFKRLGVPVKYVPMIAVMIGLLLGLTIEGLNIEGALKGLAYGLSACGLYSGTKATLENTEV